MTTRKKPTQNMFVEEEETQKPAPRRKQAKKEPEPEQKVEEGVNYLDLPSQGKLGYPSHITYRDILVKDEEVLSSATSETLTRTLNSALKSITNNCEFYEQLSIHDRDYLMIFLWANNYSPKKYVDITCTNTKCGHKETMEVDLTKVPVDDISPKIPVPFELPLDDEGHTIQVRPNTTGDEMEVEAYIATRSEEEQKSASFERLMMIASIQIDLPLSFDRKVKWVSENVSSKTLGYVRKYHQYFKFGVHDQVEHTCEKCGEVSRVDIPFQITDILFPELPDDFEKFL